MIEIPAVAARLAEVAAGVEVPSPLRDAPPAPAARRLRSAQWLSRNAAADP